MNFPKIPSNFILITPISSLLNSQQESYLKFDW